MGQCSAVSSTQRHSKRGQAGRTGEPPLGDFALVSGFIRDLRSRYDPYDEINLVGIDQTPSTGVFCTLDYVPDTNLPVRKACRLYIGLNSQILVFFFTVLTKALHESSSKGCKEKTLGSASSDRCRACTPYGRVSLCQGRSSVCEKHR